MNELVKRHICLLEWLRLKVKNRTLKKSSHCTLLGEIKRLQILRYGLGVHVHVQTILGRVLVRHNRVENWLVMVNRVLKLVLEEIVVDGLRYYWSHVLGRESRSFSLNDFLLYFRLFLDDLFL